jgi:predicted kinase
MGASPSPYPTLLTSAAHTSRRRDIVRCMSVLRLIQVVGVAGSGKSTIAYHLAKRIDAIVIDEVRIQKGLSRAKLEKGKLQIASYEVFRQLVDSILQQGKSVIFDYQFQYEILLATTRQLAERNTAEYRCIECVVPDQEELMRRRKMNSEAGDEKSEPDGFKDFYRTNSTWPKEGRLILDTTKSLTECLAEAESYVQSGA